MRRYLHLVICFALSVQIAHSLKTEVNINCGGPSNWRFTSDYTENTWWLRVWGNPQISYDQGKGVVGAEVKNRYALRTHRWKKANHGGGFGYNIKGMKPGQYECTLHFAETSKYWAQIWKRVFKAKINGIETSPIDVFGATRQMYKSYTRTIQGITVTQNSKSINVNIIAIKGDPMLSAITCAREIPSSQLVKLNHIHMNCGGDTHQEFISDWSPSLAPYVDRWGQSRTFKAGTQNFPGYTYKWKVLLHSERYSVYPHTFGYRLKKLKTGYWQCKFYFAETYWSQAGKRVIILKVNGMQRYVDVYKKVGKYKRHTESFPKFYINGEINISFNRYKGDPMISAIECTEY